MALRRLPATVAVGLALGVLCCGTAAAAATPQVFSGAGAAQVGVEMSAFETAVGGSNNARSEGGSAGGYRAPDWSQAPTGTFLMPQGTDPGGTAWIDQQWLNGYGINLTTPGTALTVTDDGFKEVDPSYPALFTTSDGTHPLAPVGSTETDVSFAVPDLYQSPWNPGPPGTSNGDLPGMTAGVAGFGAVFLNSETTNDSSIEYLDAAGRSLGTFPVPVAAQGEPEFLAVLYPDAAVASAKIIAGSAPLAPGVEDTPTTANGTNLVALDGMLSSEPVPGPSVAVSPTTRGLPMERTAVVQGMTSDPEGVPAVTVNGIPAIVGPDGSWTATIPMAPGYNSVIATATDSRGLSNAAWSFFDGVTALPGAAPRATNSPTACTLTATATVAASTGAGRHSRGGSEPVLSARAGCNASARVRVAGTVTALTRAGHDHRAVIHHFRLRAHVTHLAAGRKTTLTLALPARLISLLRAGGHATGHLVLTVAGGAGRRVTATVRL